MSDVFALLVQDHRTVDGLFQQFQQSGDPQVALQICEELTIHALLEEELVYPVLATKVGVEAAQEARREHEEAKELILQIESGAGAGEDVSQLVQQLQESVEHHVEEEENEIFPTMRNAVPEMVASMGPDVAERKEVLKQQVADALERNQSPSTVNFKATNTQTG